MKKNTNNDFTIMKTKREAGFKKIENKIKPGKRDIYHMNCKKS